MQSIKTIGGQVMKRLVVYLVIVTVLFANSAIGVFAEMQSKAPAQKKIMVYLKPDVTIELNGTKLLFKDVNRNIVYPINYNGSTYLPIRATSELMKQPIEWDGPSKTIFIGKTLSDPSGSHVNITTGHAVAIDKEDAASFATASPGMVNAYLKPDVLIMYDFVIQSFQDINGNNVYPIIYNGSTYLPIRAVSKLMNEPIEWNNKTKTVIIGNGEEKIDDAVKEDEKSLATKALRDIFSREEALYYEATAKISNIKTAISLEEKQIIATAISENYLSAQEIHTEIKGMDQSAFTTEELAFYKKLVAFVESTEYYFLVLENIAYLAAADADYSMLADTFLYFALDSQTKMDEARLWIER